MSGKLQKAVKSNRIDEVRALLDRGVDPNDLIAGSSVLALAVYWGYEPIVELLLERGANPNLGTSFPSAGGAMHAAASQARISMLPKLLEGGGDPNAPGQDDRRPLASAIDGLRPPANDWGPKRASRKTQVAMIRALLEAGARPELEDRHGASAWTAAIRTDDPEIFDLIAATDPSRVKRDGKKLLRDAAWHGSKLIDVLVERGVPADRDALDVAIVRDNAKAIERLLAHGVDPNAKVGGKTAFDVAKESGSAKAARALRRTR